MDSERQQLRAYLLGVLAEGEAAGLDERLFQSDDVLQRLEDEQQLLIEDFAKGLLSAEEESRFRAQCSRSPQLNRSVAEVQTLIAGLQRRSALMEAAKPSRFWQRFFVILSPALAFALCVAAFLYVQQRRVNVGLQARLNTPSVPQAPIQLPAGGQQLVAFLAANVTRGSASLPRIVVPNAASAVELQVEVRGTAVESGAASGSWNVSISDSGRPVWMSTRVPAHQLGSVTYLDLHLDADVLQPGAYELQLASSADTRSVQTRQFIVARGK